MATRIVLSYGTFDFLHYGHIRLLRRARKYGDKLYVGLSTDYFNQIKGKQSKQSFQLREAVLLSTGLVDEVFPESNWDQKFDDIKRFKAQVLVMGSDWRGAFDNLPCTVIYLRRTWGISSTRLRKWLR